jgi:hypothetical protein
VKIIDPGNLKRLREGIEGNQFLAAPRFPLDRPQVRMPQKASVENCRDFAGHLGFVRQLVRLKPCAAGAFPWAHQRLEDQVGGHVFASAWIG